MTQKVTTTPADQQLAALTQVMAAANSARESRALAQAALLGVLDVVSMASGALWVHEQGNPRCIASYPGETSGGAPQPDAAVARVLAGGQAEWREMPGQTGASLPLIARGELIGALDVAGPQSQMPRALLSASADVIAGALQQALLAEQVETQRYQLQTIRRQHDELLSLISHDLKNPMASIKGYADLLLRRSARTPDDPNRRGLQVISEQIVRMNDLLDTLLDVSRIAAARLRLDPRPADLARVIAQLVASLRDLAGGRELLLDGAESQCPGVFDQKRVRQAIEQVVRNAIVYSPETRPVELTLGRQGHEAVLAVRDYGIGIPPNESERIFEPFFRASNTAGSTGMGMGLYIAQQILARPGGRIWFEAAQGAGSTFFIALPLAPAQSPDPAVY
jgi:signal transduction histidine kinase